MQRSCDDRVRLAIPTATLAIHLRSGTSPCVQLTPIGIHSGVSFLYHLENFATWVRNPGDGIGLLDPSAIQVAVSIYPLQGLSAVSYHI